VVVLPFSLVSRVLRNPAPLLFLHVLALVAAAPVNLRMSWFSPPHSVSQCRFSWLSSNIQPEKLLPELPPLAQRRSRASVCRTDVRVPIFPRKILLPGRFSVNLRHAMRAIRRPPRHANHAVLSAALNDLPPVRPAVWNCLLGTWGPTFCLGARSSFSVLVLLVHLA